MSMPDPHSYLDDEQARGKHLHWRAEIDMDRRVIEASLTITLDEAASGVLDLDARDLDVRAVRTGTGEAVPFVQERIDAVKGDRLRLTLPESTDAVVIDYRTSPEASALQWLTPAQTSGGRHPFLYSQSQTVHARSFLPLQDSPIARVSFTAEVTTPANLTVLMAAQHLGSEEITGDRRRHRFAMEQTVPPYLISLAVGRLTSAELSARTRIWAEPALIESATWEFAEIDDIFSAAEQVLGPYAWGDRFDLLVLPPSYPYGGMENPGLAYLTPTLLAGDRSLVSVAAHELAHAWTGNLVTNATYDDFWINEGFTIYGERRIIEKLHGAEVAAMHDAIGRDYLDGDLAALHDRPELTRLHRDLRGLDPDAASSYVTLEKGYLFLRAIEAAVGREAFDDYLRGYLDRHRFTSLTTADFLDDITPRLGAAVDYEEWLEGTGLPVTAYRASSRRLDAVRAVGQAVPDRAVAERWNAYEWQAYLGALHPPVPHDVLEALRETYHLDDTRNDEIRFWWLLVGLRSGYSPATEAAIDMVGSVGRLKFLKPLYDALATSAGTDVARACFERFRESYHPIAVAVVDERLRRNAAATAG
jgi:leukotriene-A4 hydrolase